MKNKNFDDYEDIEIILDGNYQETVEFEESTEQATLKSLPLTEEN